MLRTLLFRLLGMPPPAPTGVAEVPAATAPVPANDVLKPPLLRFKNSGRLILPGTTVITKNNATMKVAPVVQRPPYVVCVYKGRRLLVRAENIDCHWVRQEDTIQ